MHSKTNASDPTSPCENTKNTEKSRKKQELYNTIKQVNVASRIKKIYKKQIQQSSGTELMKKQEKKRRKNCKMPKLNMGTKRALEYESLGTTDNNCRTWKKRYGTILEDLKIRKERTKLFKTRYWKRLKNTTERIVRALKNIGCNIGEIKNQEKSEKKILLDIRKILKIL